jgi:hypothetical protein
VTGTGHIRTSGFSDAPHSRARSPAVGTAFAAHGQ